MKKLFIALIPLFFAGCTLDSVSEQGAACPENGIDGKLSYIEDAQNCNADNPESCTIQGINYNYALNFKNNICPALYSSCQSKTDHETGDTIYYCSQTTVDCADGTTLCELPSGEKKCIDPSSDKTCGAQCTPEKIDGQNCKAINSSSSCMFQNDEYTCRCNDNSLLCETCISPSAPETCGAHNCSLKNYGGDNCNQYEDRFCMADENGNFSCQCQTGMILCDGQCVLAAQDSSHCGAKGACNSNDVNSPDYAGENCEAGGGLCFNGKCTCLSGGIWCTFEGITTPQCVNPNDPQTCNAHLVEDSNTCVFTACNEHQSCQMRAVNDYYCQTTSCESEDEQRCYIDNEYQCVSLFDVQRCGSCDRDCSHHNYSNADVLDCAVNTNNDNKIQCTYQCLNDTENCGTPFAPICVNTKENIHHCGACDKVCDSDQKCINGECIDTGCGNNTCAVDDGNGGKTCLNSDTQCGSTCMPCKNLHDNAYCENGTCVIRECGQDEHPEFNPATGHIIKCNKNTINACAPSNIKLNDPVHDCLAEKDSNTESVSCINGQCIATVCKPNYHLSSDQKSCIPNSKTACAATNSSTTTDCTTIDNANTTECENGTCKVTACHTNYHPNSSYTVCLLNSITECGSTTNAAIQNCTSSITHADSTACDAGICKVTACNTDYHPNTSYTACVLNSETECGSTTNATTKNCTSSISHYEAIKCEAGTCKVKTCATNYHPNSNYTNCVENSTSACGTTTSPTTQNCNDIQNANQVSCSSSGNCVVNSCNANYHITNSSKTSCTANSDTSCAATNAYNAVNCSAGIQPYCVSGTCQCSTDGSLVLNFNDTTCINKACEGVYGIVDAKLNTSKCFATECASGYKRDYDPSSNSWSVCRYKSTSISECKSVLPGVTSATLMGGTLCQATACSSSYTLYHGVCCPN